MTNLRRLPASWPDASASREAHPGQNFWQLCKVLSWEEQRRAAGEVAQAARRSEAAGIIVCGVPSARHADNQTFFVGLLSFFHGCARGSQESAANQPHQPCNPWNDCATRILMLQTHQDSSHKDFSPKSSGSALDVGKRWKTLFLAVPCCWVWCDLLDRSVFWGEPRQRSIRSAVIAS